MICNQKLSNNDDDTDEDDDINDNKCDKNVSVYNTRLKISHIPSSWLLITNVKGFVLGIIITPGILNISIFILILIYFFHKFTLNLDFLYIIYINYNLFIYIIYIH